MQEETSMYDSDGIIPQNVQVTKDPFKLDPVSTTRKQPSRMMFAGFKPVRSLYSQGQASEGRDTYSSIAYDGKGNSQFVRKQIDGNAIAKYGHKAAPLELSWNTMNPDRDIPNYEKFVNMKKLDRQLSGYAPEVGDLYGELYNYFSSKDMKGSRIEDPDYMNNNKVPEEIQNKVMSLSNYNKTLAKNMFEHADYYKHLKQDAVSELYRRYNMEHYTPEQMVKDPRAVVQAYQDVIKEKVIKVKKLENGKIQMNIDKTAGLNLMAELEKDIANGVHDDMDKHSADSWFGDTTFKFIQDIRKWTSDYRKEELMELAKETKDLATGRKVKDPVTGQWFIDFLNELSRDTKNLGVIATDLVFSNTHMLDREHSPLEPLLKSMRDMLEGQASDTMTYEYDPETNRMKSDDLEQTINGDVPEWVGMLGSNFVNTTAKYADRVGKIAIATKVGEILGSTAGQRVVGPEAKPLGKQVGRLTGALAGSIFSGLLGYSYEDTMHKEGKNFLTSMLGQTNNVDEVIGVVRELYPVIDDKTLTTMISQAPELKDAFIKQNEIAKSVESGIADYYLTANMVGNMAGDIVTTFPTYSKVAAEYSALSQMIGGKFTSTVPILKNLKQNGTIAKIADKLLKPASEAWQFKIPEGAGATQTFFKKVLGTTTEGFKLWAVSEYVKANPYATPDDILVAGRTGALFNIWSLGVGVGVQKIAQKMKFENKLFERSMAVDPELRYARQKDLLGQNKELEFQKWMMLGDMFIGNIGQGATSAALNSEDSWKGFTDYFSKGYAFADLVSGLGIGAKIGIPKYNMWKAHLQELDYYTRRSETAHQIHQDYLIKMKEARESAPDAAESTTPLAKVQDEVSAKKVEDYQREQEPLPAPNEIVNFENVDPDVEMVVSGETTNYYIHTSADGKFKLTYKDTGEIAPLNEIEAGVMLGDTESQRDYTEVAIKLQELGIGAVRATNAQGEAKRAEGIVEHKMIASDPLLQPEYESEKQLIKEKYDAIHQKIIEDVDNGMDVDPAELKSIIEELYDREAIESQKLDGAYNVIPEEYKEVLKDVESKADEVVLTEKENLDKINEDIEGLKPDEDNEEYLSDLEQQYVDYTSQEGEAPIDETDMQEMGLDSLVPKTGPLEDAVAQDFEGQMNQLDASINALIDTKANADGTYEAVIDGENKKFPNADEFQKFVNEWAEKRTNDLVAQYENASLPMRKQDLVNDSVERYIQYISGKLGLEGLDKADLVYLLSREGQKITKAITKQYVLAVHELELMGLDTSRVVFYNSLLNYNLTEQMPEGVYSHVEVIENEVRKLESIIYLALDKNAGDTDMRRVVNHETWHMYKDILIDKIPGLRKLYEAGYRALRDNPVLQSIYNDYHSKYRDQAIKNYLTEYKLQTEAEIPPDAMKEILGKVDDRSIDEVMASAYMGYRETMYNTGEEYARQYNGALGKFFNRLTYNFRLLGARPEQFESFKLLKLYKNIKIIQALQNTNLGDTIAPLDAINTNYQQQSEGAGAFDQASFKHNAINYIQHSKSVQKYLDKLKVHSDKLQDQVIKSSAFDDNSSQILKSIPELGFATTDDIVDKFRGTWSDRNTFIKDLRPLVNFTEDQLKEFVDRTMAKYHRDAYEPNKGLSILLQEDIDPRDEMYDSIFMDIESINDEDIDGTTEIATPSKLAKARTVKNVTLKVHDGKEGSQTAGDIPINPSTNKPQYIFNTLNVPRYRNSKSAWKNTTTFLNNLKSSNKVALNHFIDGMTTESELFDVHSTAVLAKAYNPDGIAKGAADSKYSKGVYDERGNYIANAQLVDMQGRVDAIAENNTYYKKQKFSLEADTFKAEGLDILRRLMTKGFIPTLGSDKSVSFINATSFFTRLQKVLSMELGTSGYRWRNSNGMINVDLYGNRAQTQRVVGQTLSHFIQAETDIVTHALKSELMSKYDINPDDLFIDPEKQYNILDGLFLTEQDGHTIARVSNKRAVEMLAKEESWSAKGKAERNEIEKMIVEYIKSEQFDKLKESIDRFVSDLDNVAVLLPAHNVMDYVNEHLVRLGKPEIDTDMTWTVQEILDAINIPVSNGDLGNETPNNPKNAKFDKLSELLGTEDNETAGVVACALGTLLRDKTLAIFDTLQTLSIDPSGEGLLYHTTNNNKFKLTKYLNKYASYLKYDRPAPPKSTFDQILQANGIMDENRQFNHLAPKSLVIDDGEVKVRSYVFDPQSWEELSSNYRQMGNEDAATTIESMLNILGSKSIDAGTYSLNDAANNEGKNIHEVIALAGAAKKFGSLKTKAFIEDGTNRSPLKHAIHPLYMDNTNIPYPSPGALLANALVKTLKDNGVGLLVFTSSIKGNGVYQSKPNGDYYTSHSGKRLWRNQNGKKIPLGKEEITMPNMMDEKGKPIVQTVDLPPDQKLTETPYRTFSLEEMGFSSLNDLNAYGADLQGFKTASLDFEPLLIPLTGKNGMAWDSQKGDPHSKASSSPWRMPAFNPDSPYMQFDAKTSELAMTLGMQTGADTDYVTGHDILLNYFKNATKETSHIFKGYNEVTTFLDNLAKGIAQSPDFRSMVPFLTEMEKTLDRLSRNEEDSIWESVDQDDTDQDRSSQSNIERSNLRHDHDLIKYMLEPYLRKKHAIKRSAKAKFDIQNRKRDDKSELTFQGLSQRDIEMEIPASDWIIIENRIKQQLPALITMSDILLQSDSNDPMLRQGVGTIGWKVLKNSAYNSFMGRGKGTISVLDADINAYADVLRAVDYAENKAKSDNVPFNKELFTKIIMDEVVDPETGTYGKGTQGVSVSRDILNKHGWNIGEKVFAVLTPPDSIQSFAPMVITGLLPEGKRNTITFNKELSLALLGRDHDIDTMSLLGRDSNWLDGYDYKDPKLGNIHKTFDTFDVFHKLLTEKGIHKGSSKEALLRYKDNIDKSLTMKEVETKGKIGKVKIPMHNMESVIDGKTHKMANTYSPDDAPILSPLNASDAWESRSKFGDGKIGVFAKFGNDIGQALSKLERTEMAIDGPTYDRLESYLKSIKKEIPAEYEALLRGLKFEFKADHGKADMLFPYQKEGAVDRFTKHPYKLDEIEWLADFAIINITLGDNTKFNSLSDMKYNAQYINSLPIIKEVLNKAISELITASQGQGDPTGAVKTQSISMFDSKHIRRSVDNNNKNNRNVFTLPPMRKSSIDGTILAAMDSRKSQYDPTKINLPAIKAQLENMSSDQVMLQMGVLGYRNPFKMYGNPLTGQKFYQTTAFDKSMSDLSNLVHNLYTRIAPEAIGFETRIMTILNAPFMLTANEYIQAQHPKNIFAAQDSPFVGDQPILWGDNTTAISTVASLSVMRSLVHTMLNVDHKEAIQGADLFSHDGTKFKYTYDNKINLNFASLNMNKQRNPSSKLSSRDAELFGAVYMESADKTDVNYTGMSDIPYLELSTAYDNINIPLNEMFNSDIETYGLHPKLYDFVRDIAIDNKKSFIIDEVSDPTMAYGYDKMLDINKELITKLPNLDAQGKAMLLMRRKLLDKYFMDHTIGRIVDGLVNSKKYPDSELSPVGPISSVLRGKKSKDEFVSRLYANMALEMTNQLAFDMSLAKKSENLSRMYSLVAGHMLTHFTDQSGLAAVYKRNLGDQGSFGDKTDKLNMNYIQARSMFNDRQQVILDKAVNLINKLPEYSGLSPETIDSIRESMYIHREALKQYIGNLKNQSDFSPREFQMKQSELASQTLTPREIFRILSSAGNTIMDNPNFKQIYAERGKEAEKHLRGLTATAKEFADAFGPKMKSNDPKVLGYTPLGKKLMAEFENKKYKAQIEISKDPNNRVYVDAIDFLRSQSNIAGLQRGGYTIQKDGQYSLPFYEHASLVADMQNHNKTRIVDGLNQTYNFLLRSGMSMKGRVSYNDFEDSLDKFLKGKAFPDGTPITFRELFVNGKAAASEDHAVASEYLLNQFLSQEIANILGIPAGERVQYFEDLRKQAPTVEDKFVEMTMKSLNRISTYYGDIVRAAMEADPSITKYYMNEMAIQAYNAFKVTRNFEKNLERAKRNYAMAQDDPSAIQSYLSEANIFEMNTPHAIAAAFSNQKALIEPTNTIFAYKEYGINESGDIMPDKDVVFTASMLQNGQILPTTSVKSIEIASRAGLPEDALLPSTLPLVETSPAEIVMAMGSMLKNMELQNNKLSEMHISNIARYHEQLASPELESKLAQSEQILSKHAEKLFKSLKIKFNKYDGKIHPLLEFSDSTGKITRGQITAEGNFDNLVTDIMRDLLATHQTNGIQFVKDMEAAGLKEMIPTIISKFLAIKLYNGHKAAQAQQQKSVIEGILRTDELDILENPSNTNLYDQFAAGVLKDLDYVIDMGLSNSPEAMTYIPYKSVTLTQEVHNFGLMFDALNKKVASVLTNNQRIRLEYFDKSEQDYLKAYSEYMGYNELTDSNVLNVLMGVGAHYQSLLDKSRRGDDSTNKEVSNAIYDISSRMSSSLNSQIMFNRMKIATNDMIGYTTSDMLLSYDREITSNFVKSTGELLKSLYANRHDTIFKERGMEESKLVSNEVMGFLTHFTGERVIYNEPMDVHQGVMSEPEQGSLVEIKYVNNIMQMDQLGETIMVPRNMVARGLYLGKSNGYHTLQTSNGRLQFAKDGDIQSGVKGYSITKGDRMLYDEIASALRSGVSEATFRTIDEIQQLEQISNTPKTEENARIVNDAKSQSYRLQRELTSELRDIENNASTAIGRAIKNAPAVAIGLGYLGGAKALKATVGFAGAVVSLVLGQPGLVGKFSSFAMNNVLGFASNTGKRVFQNVFSNARTLFEMEGFTTTINELAGVLSQRVNAAEKNITQATLAFTQSELINDNALTRLSQGQIGDLIDVMDMSKKNLTQLTESEGISLDIMTEKVRNGEFTRSDVIALVATAQKQLKHKLALEKNPDGISYDIIEMIDKLKYDPATKEFVTDHGYDMAFLMQAKRNMLQNVTEGMLRISSIIPKSEEWTRQHAHNAITNSMLNRKLNQSFSDQELILASENFLNISGGQYGMHSRTVLGNSELGRFLTMYGRFNKNNAVYYMNHVWDKIDEQMFIEQLGQENPALYGMSNKGLPRLSGLSKSSGEGNETIAAPMIDYNYLNAVKRKIALGSSIALTSVIAKMGAMALSLMVAGSWAEELFPKAERNTEDPTTLKDFDQYIGMGGSYSAGIELVMAMTALGTLNEGELLNKKVISKYEFNDYWRNSISSPTAFMFGAGLGGGYSNMAGSGIAMAVNYGSHLLRDKTGPINQSDEAFKSANISITNSFLRGIPFFSSIYDVGMLVPAVYHGSQTGSDVGNNKLIKEMLGTKK